MYDNFYPLRISDIQQSTTDSVLISFDIRPQWKSIFSFKAGQYLTLKTRLNGEFVQRCYSLCSSPLDKTWQVAIKRIPNGLFSTHATTKLKKGSILEVMSPKGFFHIPHDVTQAKNYVVFAAGSGITPLFSILKTQLALEPNSTFQLLYVNRSPETVMLSQELLALEKQYGERLKVYHFFTRQTPSNPLFSGRIDRQKLQQIFEQLIHLEQVDDYLICGPSEMIFTIRDYLLAQGVADKAVHFELFNALDIANLAIPLPKKNAEIELVHGGEKYHFRFPKGANTILDAAIQNDVKLPFSCKSGTCGTCTAKLVEGTAEMIANHSLNETAVAVGYILTCQAVPTSDKVVMDCD